MADSDSPAAVATPKKGKGAGKPKKTKTTPSHPKVSEMVNAAISTLKERGGSSLQAIKKYIASHYKVDIERLSPFIKKYLKTAVASGTLVQTKGKGATGSFRMSASATTKEKSVPKAKKPKRETAPPKKPKATPKKVAKPKKVAEKKKPKKPAAAAKKPKPAKSPKKPKAAKPKAAKPKKAKATPKKGGKRGRK